MLYFYTAIVILAIIFFSLASSRVVTALRRYYSNPPRGGLLIAVLLFPYLLATLPEAAGNPQAVAFSIWKLLAYLYVPGLLLINRPGDKRSLDLFDFLAILALWLPVELGWMGNGLVTTLTATCLGLLLYRVIRPLDRLGYSYLLNPKDVGYALAALAGYAVVAIPLGLVMDFYRPGPQPFPPIECLTRLLQIYFLIAIPKELLFRGVIQNMIEARLGKTVISLLLAALVFGFAHLNNTTPYNTPPNWPYLIVATLAGLAYGWVWRRSEKITASAITHALYIYFASMFFNP